MSSSLTWLRYEGSATISSDVFRSFSVIGRKGEALSPDRLCRALSAALRTSRTGELRQHSNDGKTARQRRKQRHLQLLLHFIVTWLVFHCKVVAAQTKGRIKTLTSSSTSPSMHWERRGRPRDRQRKQSCGRKMLTCIFRSIRFWFLTR